MGRAVLLTAGERGERVQRVSPSGVVSFDYVRKRFSGFNRFRRFNGGGAAHKNMEAPRRFETSGFLVSQT